MAMSCMGALPKPQRHDPQHVGLLRILAVQIHRLYELDAQLPRLYVMPMTSLLGKLSVAQAGNTGTIPYSMRGRAAECYPGGKCDSTEGKGDGSRLYFVNQWTTSMK